MAHELVLKLERGVGVSSESISRPMLKIAQGAERNGIHRLLSKQDPNQAKHNLDDVEVR